jgi:hypothetical protein
VTGFLEPSVATDRIYPERTAFMARTDLNQTRLLGYTAFNQDAVTTLLSGLLNGRPVVRHVSGVTPAILQTYARAGLRVVEDVRPYHTAAEADALAGRLIEEDYRLIFPYPLPEGRYPEAGQLVPPELWHLLNSKENLSRIVPAENLMPHRMLRLTDVAGHPFPGPVWLKAAGAQATGWGYAVRFCPERETVLKAVASFAAMPGVTHLIAEEDAGVTYCWCASIVVGDQGTTYAGFAEQDFAGPGRQKGSVIDPEHPFPLEGQRLACAVGDAARALGFRGIAGLDIGQRVDGRMVVFDPNFRFNSSTAQAMFHASAARRAGLPASRSFHHAGPRTCLDLTTRLAGPIDAGWFVPTRLLDAALLPAADGKSVVTGFVLGHDQADTTRRTEALLAWLAV